MENTTVKHQTYAKLSSSNTILFMILNSVMILAGTIEPPTITHIRTFFNTWVLDIHLCTFTKMKLLLKPMIKSRWYFKGKFQPNLLKLIGSDKTNIAKSFFCMEQIRLQPLLRD